MEPSRQVVEWRKAWLYQHPPCEPLTSAVQDVHWSAGLFGYFPTYSLGAMYAAQIYKVSPQEAFGCGVWSSPQALFAACCPVTFVMPP